MHPVSLRSILLNCPPKPDVPCGLFLSFISTRPLYVFLHPANHSEAHIDLLALSCLKILGRIQIMKLHVEHFLCHSIFPMALRPNACYGFLILEVSRSYTTVSSTPLEEGSARCRDLYLTTHSTHNRQTSMSPAGFEPTISAGWRPQTHVSDRAATGTSRSHFLRSIYFLQRPARDTLSGGFP